MESFLQILTSGSTGILGTFQVLSIIMNFSVTMLTFWKFVSEVGIFSEKIFLCENYIY